jgi:formylglycine-generating enzyme required for sulfatase activity
LVLRNAGANTFLPSENEWYKAAYYDGLLATYYDFPAGVDVLPVCSAATAAPNSANCANAAGGVTDVGAYLGSASPYGTFDQGGNVVEWNEQIVSVATFTRGVRGESWSGSGSGLAAAFPGSSFLNNEGVTNGFRVASLIPEPDTGLLVMTGLLGLAYRQRRIGRAAHGVRP